MPEEKLARALGSKIRRDIIHKLLKKEHTVNEISKILKISEVNSSKHLKKLFDLGLLNTKVAGRKRLYSIKIKELKNLIKWYDITALKIGTKNE
jgi:DNA-binding transcriptional ArsR family regulator